MSDDVSVLRHRYWGYVRQRLVGLLALSTPSWVDLWDLDILLNTVAVSDYEGRIEADLVDRAETRLSQWYYELRSQGL